MIFLYFFSVIIYFSVEDLAREIMKVKGKMSLSSRLWLDRQMNDPYVKRAHKEGYRSLTAYKLLGIDKMFKI